MKKLDRQIISYYQHQNGINFKKRHVKKVTNKQNYIDYLKGNKKNLDWVEPKSLIKKYFKHSTKLLLPKQPKLRKHQLKYLIELNLFFSQIDQSKKRKDNNVLNTYEKERWVKHLNHPLINQKKIHDTKIVVFGLGGIGSNTLIGLLYNGIKNIKIVDYDKVGFSNLNRQILYKPKDVGQLKYEVAKKRLLDINPNIDIQAYNFKIKYPLTANILNNNNKDVPKEIQEIEELIKWGDIIINAVDYYGAPYLINDLCIRNSKPYYWGGGGYIESHVFSFSPQKKTPCLRCIYNSSQEVYRYRTSNIEGVGESVLGSTIMIAGNMIVNLILSDINNLNHDNYGKYLIFDNYKLTLQKIPLKRNKYCFCGQY